MPKVSVVLTSYNHENFIREAIDSVLGQTFEDWELIILDDVSPDNSWEIIQSYQDPRIKTIRNDRTRRYIYNINRAINELSTGEYIAIHHSDDAWELEKLTEQVAILDANPQIAAAFTHVQCIDEKNHKLDIDWFNQKNRSRTEWLRVLFHNQNRFCHPSALVRRSAYQDVGLYKCAHAQIDDAEMWTRLLIKHEVHVIQKKLTRHRIFSDNSNVSGDRPDRRARLQFEWFQQKQHYKNLNTTDLLKILPEARQWLTCEESEASSRFLLAMAAIHAQNSTGTRLFGLNLLYDLLTDYEEARRIESAHSFNYLDFINMTGQENFFATDPVLTTQDKHSSNEVQTPGIRQLLIRLLRGLTRRIEKTQIRD